MNGEGAIKSEMPAMRVQAQLTPRRLNLREGSNVSWMQVFLGVEGLTFGL